MRLSREEKGYISALVYRELTTMLKKLEGLDDREEKIKLRKRINKQQKLLDKTHK